MSYATRAAMIARFGEVELIDRTDLAVPRTDAIVDAVLEPAMAAADAEIEAAVRGRYALPLSPVPTLVVDLACDLARWRLWPTDAPEWVESRAKAARSLLERIARGLMVIEAAPLVASGGEVAFDSSAPTFTHDTLRGW